MKKSIQFMLATALLMSISMFASENETGFSRGLCKENGLWGKLDDEGICYDIKETKNIENFVELIEHARAGFIYILHNYLNALKSDNKRKSARDFEKFQIQGCMYEELYKQLQDNMQNLTSVNGTFLEHLKPEIQEQLHGIILHSTQPPFYAFSYWTKAFITLMNPVVFTIGGCEIGQMLADYDRGGFIANVNNIHQWTYDYMVQTALRVMGTILGIVSGSAIGIASWWLPSPGDYLNPTSFKEQLDMLEKMIETLGAVEKKLALSTEIKAAQLELARI